MPATSEVAKMTHLITNEGIGVIILACVVILGFLYFWKMLGKKTSQEKACDAHGVTLGEIVKRLQRVREDLIEIKVLITGTFRNLDKEE